MQVALADGVGNEGQPSVRKLCLGELLGLQGRVNTGRIVFLAPAAVIAACSAVIPVVAAGTVAVVAGILRAALGVVWLIAALIIIGILHGLVRRRCGIRILLAPGRFRWRLRLILPLRFRGRLRRLLGRVGIFCSFGGFRGLGVPLSGTLSAGIAGALQGFRPELLRLGVDWVVRPCPPGGDQ